MIDDIFKILKPNWLDIDVKQLKDTDNNIDANNEIKKSIDQYHEFIYNIMVEYFHDNNKHDHSNIFKHPFNYNVELIHFFGYIYLYVLLRAL